MTSAGGSSCSKTLDVAIIGVAEWPKRGVSPSTLLGLEYDDHVEFIQIFTRTMGEVKKRVKMYPGKALEFRLFNPMFGGLWVDSTDDGLAIMCASNDPEQRVIAAKNAEKVEQATHPIFEGSHPGDGDLGNLHDGKRHKDSAGTASGRPHSQPATSSKTSGVSGAGVLKGDETPEGRLSPALNPYYPSTALLPVLFPSASEVNELSD